MRQYFELKSKYKDTILLYRMGDFYETFDEDARAVHKVLGITLTKRANGKAAEVALAGFPYHSLDVYMPKLLRAGYRVAVCEQVEDPKLAKGLVKRDVIEIVTPGTTISDKILDQKTNNYLASVISEKQDNGVTIYGVALIDASTGEFFAGEFAEEDFFNEINLFRPAEIIVPYSLHDAMREKMKIASWPFIITRQEDWLFTSHYGYDLLIEHFKTHSLKGFGIESLTVGVASAGAALHYLRETQRTNLNHIRAIRLWDRKDTMTLDSTTLRNLEIFSGEGFNHGGLIATLDFTETPMGARLLKKWILKPLIKVEPIQDRLNSVGELVQESLWREDWRSELKSISDLERLVSKACALRIVPREVNGLRFSLEVIPILRQKLSRVKSSALVAIFESLTPLPELVNKIQRALKEDAPALMKDGGYIREGYSQELDQLRQIAYDGKNYLAAIQQRERERTGISSLKVQFNNVFGYYIEITHTHKDKVPSDYIRKQTMVNAERFITPELKEYEEKILTAEDKIGRLESEIFDQLRKEIADHAAEILSIAVRIAELDVFISLAEAAFQHKYCKPLVSDSDWYLIEEGRHPVVERILPPGEPFIPNDLGMNSQTQIMLITGPNMAGKSCYLRQVGLIAMMAQMGSFVPARRAEIGVFDRIFTRVGASDNLGGGESTFLVEMNETANILHNATSRSLILLDEIGRGTSTFDGLSLAWAITEYLHEHPTVKPKTLFATHYHELNELEELLPAVKNFNMVVKKYDDKIVFLRKIVRGGSDHSYGIEVAKLAGLPAEIISRSKAILKNLESHNLSATRKSEIGMPQPEITLFDDVTGIELKNALKSISLDSLTPIEALNKLHELKKIMEEK